MNQLAVTACLIPEDPTVLAQQSEHIPNLHQTQSTPDCCTNILLRNNPASL